MIKSNLMVEKMNKSFLLLFFLLLFYSVSIAQISISGYVYDNTTKEPLEGVSVFFDGTSIGTISNENGFFELTTNKTISTSLVISYIGYKTEIFNSTSGSLGKILLKENTVQLNEIVLTPDTWSREKKLNIFRGEFLGKTTAALNSKIENEDAIRLYYNKEKNTLYAYAEVPIKVVNTYLGYKIAYNLHDFEVNFGDISKKFDSSTWAYMAGTLFFSELNPKRLKKKYLKNREKTYLGSTLHFMRSLSQKKLDEEKFQIFKEKFQIPPYTEFIIQKHDGFTEIKQTTESLTILYDGKEQSTIQVYGDSFAIDDFGNHSPAQNVFFGGVLGQQRVGNILPLDYTIPKE